MLEKIAEINGSINGVVWGIFGLALLIGTGIKGQLMLYKKPIKVLAILILQIAKHHVFKQMSNALFILALIHKPALYIQA